MVANRAGKQAQLLKGISCWSAYLRCKWWTWSKEYPKLQTCCLEWEGRSLQTRLSPSPPDTGTMPCVVTFLPCFSIHLLAFPNYQIQTPILSPFLIGLFTSTCKELKKITFPLHWTGYLFFCGQKIVFAVSILSLDWTQILFIGYQKYFPACKRIKCWILNKWSLIAWT